MSGEVAQVALLYVVALCWVCTREIAQGELELRSSTWWAIALGYFGVALTTLLGMVVLTSPGELYPSWAWMQGSRAVPLSAFVVWCAFWGIRMLNGRWLGDAGTRLRLVAALVLSAPMLLVYHAALMWVATMLFHGLTFGACMAPGSCG